MTAQEVCLKAADVIEERGWTRGALEQRGRVCLIGAINTVCFGEPIGLRKNHRKSAAKSKEAAMELLSFTIAPGSYWRCVSVVGFNDTAKSRKVVIDLLRKAGSA